MALFYGAACSERDRESIVANTRSNARTFANGVLVHEVGAVLHERDGDLCVAVGAPRFLDAEFAKRAETDGIAAAWMTAFETLGVEAPRKVADRFAVLWIRPARRTLVFATDRFATWPICFAADQGNLFFANRADRVPGRRPISLQSLHAYLLFHVIPSPETVFDGVERLPAGAVLSWQDGQAELRHYWRPAFDERPSSSLEQAEQTFRALVRDAVVREAASGQVGAFLSGGTDSSTISGMLSEIAATPPKTYSIGFDVAGYDEMAYARIAARHFKTVHREYYVTPDDLAAAIPKVVEQSDQPFGNSSAAPALICAERAKADGTDKLLAGDGGDELFGGNTRYAKQRVFGLYQSLPAGLRSAVLEPLLALGVAKNTPLVKKAASYSEQARIPMPDRLHSYNLLSRLGLDAIFEPAYLAAVDTGRPFAQQRECWASIDAESELNKMLAFDWKYTLVDSDLPKVINATEAAGVEVAFPFLADELVTFSSQLDPEWKLRAFKLRWFFKRALRDFLPIEILKKKKHGFGLPFGAWACRHAGLSALSREALRSFAGRGVVRPAFVNKLLDELLPAHSGYYGELVWVLMMLELWLQRNEPGYRLQ